MSYLLFELSGDLALWRNVYDSMGSYSCLGPAPSNLAGLIGAALGFASPRSQAAHEPEAKILQAMKKGGLPWPVSSELLVWEKENDFHLGCRWIGGVPRRIPWNVNGCKEINKSDNLRMQQQLIEHPQYEIVLALHQPIAEQVAAALQHPAFPLYLGASFCRAIIRNVRILEAVPASANWAFRSEYSSIGEVVPFSRHVFDAGACFERIQSDGYWVYPTPEIPGVLKTDPLVRGWVPKQEDKA